MKGLRQLSCCVARGCSGSLLSFLSSKICCRPWLCRLYRVSFVHQVRCPRPSKLSCIFLLISESVAFLSVCRSVADQKGSRHQVAKRALPFSTAQKGDLMVISTNRQKPEAPNANSFFQNMFSCICWIAQYIESLYKGRMLHRGQTHAWPITVVKYPVEVGISFARWKLKETANSICPFNCLWAVSTAGQWLWRLDARNHAAAVQANVLQALLILLSAQTKCKIHSIYIHGFVCTFVCSLYSLRPAKS